MGLPADRTPAPRAGPARFAVFVLLLGLIATGAMVPHRHSALPGQSAAAAVVRGSVREAGNPAPGAMVTLRLRGASVTQTVVTDERGVFDFGPVAAGSYTATAERAGPRAWARELVVNDEPVELEFELRPRLIPITDWNASAFLGLLPNGVEKRRFILDCAGCHVLDASIAWQNGMPRAHQSWIESVERMLGFAGPTSTFPVIAAGRVPEATADFMTRHIGDGSAGRLGTLPVADPATANAIITEYDIPEPSDLPHDLAVLDDGRVLITGMFTHRMYLLDPESGWFETSPIPVANANPRAVEVAPNGDWFVLLGAPGRIARFSPQSGEWQSWPVGLYGHSIGIDASGRVWFNGHFSRNPEIIGYVNPAAGEERRYVVPAHPDAGIGAGPIPYELRIGPDGRVWISELIGNRVIVLDPEAEAFEVHTMPTPHSGPRRLDVAPDGTVWIPEYANNTLARLGSASPARGPSEQRDVPSTVSTMAIDAQEMREYPLPIPDAAPYVVRVDPRNGLVWIATGAADAILSFDPARERFTVYRLPTRGALVRHIDIAPNGDVWAAYGASPGIPSKVARLRIRET